MPSEDKKSNSVNSNHVTQIRKRDNRVVEFQPVKIEDAIFKALQATRTGGRELAITLGTRAVEIIQQKYTGSVPGVEDVQDVVEQVLMAEGHPVVAKAYILYRDQRSALRQIKNSIGVSDDLKLGVNALKVLERRYLLRDLDGNLIETPRQLFHRVAHTIAAVETKFNPGADIHAIEDTFFNLMSNLEFLPNTPTLMNAGGPLGQLSACFVLPVEDSIANIFESVKNMALVHQSGGGTGFTFSHLRPKGDIVRSTKGIASGPVSFMKVFDIATGVMKQGGKRRGANMGILNVDHPDIQEFVLAKGEEGVLSNFNLSVAATDAFMEAVQNGSSWPLINPRSRQEVKSLNARDFFDIIVNNAWRGGDPGLVFLDEINRRNPTPHLGRLEATNPCGELPLFPFESCNLGSINLSKMVKDKNIDWPKLKSTVHICVRFLDNVIEAGVFPLAEIEHMTRDGNRKIGLGVMGLADMLVELGIPYNSEQALGMAENVIKFIFTEARQASGQLGVQRGVFPNYHGSVYEKNGGPPLRNATVVSIAPTGTISIIAGCSSGIEPLFGLAFVRNVMEGTRLLEVSPIFERVARERGFYSRETMEDIARKGSLYHVSGIPSDIKEVFVTDWDIEPEWHVRMQAVFQKYSDNSVSKTVNLPPESNPEDIRHVYLLAHELKCKGITVYRYGSKKDQVLTFPGEISKNASEPSPFLTVDSEFSGGCALCGRE